MVLIYLFCFVLIFEYSKEFFREIKYENMPYGNMDFEK